MKKKLNEKIKAKNILIIFFNLIYISSYEMSNRNDTINIILPLNHMEIVLNESEIEKLSDPLSLIINKIIPNNIYINLTINYSKIEIPAYLTFNSPYNYFGLNSCINLEKKVIYNITGLTEKLSGINLFNNIYQDYFYFKENISISIFNKDYETIDLEKIDIIIPEENERKAECLILGLNPSKDNKNKLDNFPVSLKNTKYKNLKSYLTIIYNYSQEYKKIFSKILNKTNSNSLLIFGEPLYILLPNIFNINNYKEIDNLSFKKNYEEYYSKSSEKNPWSIQINNVYFNDIKISNYYIGLFSIDYNTILLPMELFSYYIEIFNNNYSQICYKKGRPLSRKFTHSLENDKRQTFIFIYCEKNKIKNLTRFYDSLPIFKLRSDSLNKTFEFSGNELFTEDENYSYLMLMPDLFSKMKITLGKIFMEKYLFSFNYETNKIGFYENTINLKELNKLFFNNFSIKIYQVFLIIIFLGILLILFNFNFKNKNKNQVNKRINYFDNKNKLNEEELIEVNNDNHKNF